MVNLQLVVATCYYDARRRTSEVPLPGRGEGFIRKIVDGGAAASWGDGNDEGA